LSVGLTVLAYALRQRIIIIIESFKGDQIDRRVEYARGRWQRGTGSEVKQKGLLHQRP